MKTTVIKNIRNAKNFIVNCCAVSYIIAPVFVFGAFMRLFLLLVFCLSASFAYSASHTSDSDFPESRDEVDRKRIGSVFDNFEGNNSKNPVTKLFGGNTDNHQNTDKSSAKNNDNTKHIQFEALWSAAMQVLSDKPIAVSDSSGGIISTDWHQNKTDKNKQSKINVVIDKASSVKVTIFKRTLDAKTNQWIDDQLDNLDKDAKVISALIRKKATKLSEK